MDSTNSKPATIECVSCGEAFPVNLITRAACTHDYCHGCLRTLFSFAVNENTACPPRCCHRPILVNATADILGEELLTRVLHKQLELATVDRVYCSNHRCSRFIAPDEINAEHGYASCKECHQQTCLDCKQARHAVGECVRNADAEVDELASKQGWRRCPRCHIMVELKDGCNHITCYCDVEFCYLCGASPWKTCDCSQYNDAPPMFGNPDGPRLEGFLEPQVNRDPLVYEYRIERHDVAPRRYRAVPFDNQMEGLERATRDLLVADPQDVAGRVRRRQNLRDAVVQQEHQEAIALEEIANFAARNQRRGLDEQPARRAGQMPPLAPLIPLQPDQHVEQRQHLALDIRPEERPVPATIPIQMPGQLNDGPAVRQHFQPNHNEAVTRDCTHRGRWDTIRGRHICEDCRTQLSRFILTCSGCGLSVCVRCSHRRRAAARAVRPNMVEA